MKKINKYLLIVFFSMLFVTLVACNNTSITSSKPLRTIPITTTTYTEAPTSITTVVTTTKPVVTTTVTTTKAPVITSIDILEPPTKKNYLEGETFDPTGLVLEVSYNEGEPVIVSSGYEYSNTELILDDGAVAVTYENKTVWVEIVVEALILTSITVTTPPNKTAYSVGDMFDPEGMRLTASYSNAPNREIDFFEYPTHFLTLSDTSITISYNGLEIEFLITIS